MAIRALRGERRSGAGVPDRVVRIQPAKEIMKSTSALGLVLVAACGPGLAARDTRDVGRDSLASAAGDAKALRALFHDNVVDGGIWFDDAACAKEFGAGEEVPKDRLDAFAQCLAGLHMQ